MSSYRVILTALGCVMLCGGAFAQTAAMKSTIPNTPPNHTGGANTNDPTASSDKKAGVGFIEGLKDKSNGSSDVSSLDHAFAEQASRYAAAQVATGRLALKESHNSKVTEYA